jgi:hypothetical protein
MLSEKQSFFESVISRGTILNDEIHICGVYPLDGGITMKCMGDEIQNGCSGWVSVKDQLKAGGIVIDSLHR